MPDPSPSTLTKTPTSYSSEEVKDDLRSGIVIAIGYRERATVSRRDKP